MTTNTHDRIAADIAADLARLIAQRDELRATIANLDGKRDVKSRIELNAARDVLTDVEGELRAAKLAELRAGAGAARAEAVRLTAAATESRQRIEPAWRGVRAVTENGGAELHTFGDADIARAVKAWSAWLPAAVEIAKLEHDAQNAAARGESLTQRARMLEARRGADAGMWVGDDPILAEMLAADAPATTEVIDDPGAPYRLAMPG